MGVQMSKRFVDSQLKYLKPIDKRYVRYDDGGKGFGIRVEPSGRKTFFFEYRFDGRNRTMTIGRYPQTTLNIARSKALQAKVAVDDGIDPGLERRNKKQVDREAFTVEDLAREYIERHAKPKNKSWRVDQARLNKHVIPAVGRRKAKDIRRRDIIVLIDEVMEHGGPIANRIKTLIVSIFNFAVQRDILDASPCISIPNPFKEKPRERWLSEEEIKIFWDGLDGAAMDNSLKLALKLILVTSQRPGEVIGAEWAEVDLNKGWWEIPSEKTKNKKRHRVPLSNLAIQILKEIKTNSTESRWVFHSLSSRRGNNHIAKESLPRAVQRNLSIFNIEHFYPHDLRRTASSWMGSIGIRRENIEKVLNHADGSTRGRHYDFYDYDKEKRQALEAWGRKLESILTGKKAKVVNLK
jgi:integrase